MNVARPEGEMFTNPEARRSTTELTPDQARGIKALLEGYDEMHRRLGITPTEPTLAELALAASVDYALHKEEVLNQAVQHYKDHKLASDEVKFRREIIDISIGPWGSRHGDLLTSWRNLDDRNALRQANIIEENTNIMADNYEAANKAYATNLTEASEHFENHHLIYKSQAIQEAQARGIDISYPPLQAE